MTVQEVLDREADRRLMTSTLGMEIVITEDRRVFDLTPTRGLSGDAKTFEITSDNINREVTERICAWLRIESLEELSEEARNDWDWLVKAVFQRFIPAEILNLKLFDDHKGWPTWVENVLLWLLWIVVALVGVLGIAWLTSRGQ